MCALTSSGLGFRYSYLYIVIYYSNIFEGEAGHFGGGSFYPSNTLDRTLHMAYNFV